MASEDLPSSFDIVILGTGLTETIAAAAFSRIGLTVLHLDRNNYYGGAYGNFNLEQIEEWKDKNEKLASPQEVPPSESEDISKHVCEGGSSVTLPLNPIQAYCIKTQFHVRERTEDEEAKAKEAKSRRFKPLWPVVDTPKSAEDADSSKEKVNPDSTDCKFSVKDQLNGNEINTQGDVNKEEITPEQWDKNCSKSEQKLTKDVPDQQTVLTDKQVDEGPTMALHGKGDSKHHTDKLVTETEQTQIVSDKGEKQEGQSVQKPEDQKGIKSDIKTSKEWTAGCLKDEWRRFCFDLSPKVLHCCGDVVQLLIRSDVARYCEFKTVSRVLTLLKGELQQVPCSRSDVFSSKLVSLVEKRLMMKFLQFAAVYNTKPEEYKDYADKPFIEFLKSRKMSPNLQHFIQHAIAMVPDTETTEESLKKTQKFLQSLGKYGNTAFLFPLYGTGELPQAFSRLSAVFGGVYCLMMTASHLLTDAENKCCGIITSNGNKIECKYVVGEQTYLPSSFLQSENEIKTSRAIYITDRSIKKTTEEELSLLNFIGDLDPSRPVTLLELPNCAMVCPKDLYVVHLTRESACDDPEDDFTEIRNKLFSDDLADDSPHILWSLHYHMADRSRPVLTSDCASGVMITSGGGDTQVDMDYCVAEAERIFKTVCPDEEFLPTPPNPEDIIHVDDTEAPTDTAEGGPEFGGEGDSSGVKSVGEEGAMSGGEETVMENEAKKEGEETVAKEKETSKENENTEEELSAELETENARSIKTEDVPQGAKDNES